ncbi:MAG TPA: tetratricopeptide repeat protein, partial [Polyangiaceae bacterium]
YDEDPRLRRVWTRLEAGIGRRPARSRPSLVLAPALGLALFAAGVFVGRNVVPPAGSEPQMLAERPQLAEPSRATPRPAADSPQRPAAPAPSSRPRPTSPRVASASDVVVAEPRVEPEIVAAPLVPPPGPPEWLRLAELGDFAGARTALDQEGGFEFALAQASPEQLLVLVDVARASGGRDQAIRALRRLLERFPGAPEAPLAAWTLGNMLEQSGDGAGAAEAFALYRRLSPAGDFAEDAAARQVHVALSQGNLELAVRLLDQYEKDFPNGRRLSEFREELAKLEAEGADAGAGVAPPPLAEESPDLELPPPY